MLETVTEDNTLVYRGRVTKVKKLSETKELDLSSGQNPSEKDETPCVHRTLCRFPIFIRIFNALSIMILAG